MKWQCNFFSVAHAYDFKYITDVTLARDPMDVDDCTVFDLQQNHTCGILVSCVKESSVLPASWKYSDPNATNYGNAHFCTRTWCHTTQKGLLDTNA